MERLRSIRIQSIDVHAVTEEEAIAFALAERKGVCFVATPNAVMLDAARRDPDLAALLLRADLSLADGCGILLAARRTGNRLPCRVAGISFGEALLAEAAEKGLRVFLLGGKEGVAQEAAERLQKKYNGLCICGCFWGYFERTKKQDEHLIQTILQAKTDILLVCMGFPEQERWIDSHRKRLTGVRVAAGLGGSLDVWAGRVPRAPRVIRSMGLEWAWRMAREPKRLRHLPALWRCAVRK